MNTNTHSFISKEGRINPMFNKELGRDSKDQEEALCQLLVNIRDNGDDKAVQIKTTLHKVKILNTYKDNMKALGAANKIVLRDSLQFLSPKAPSGWLDTLLLEGLRHEIIQRILDLMPHQCAHCLNPVKYNIEESPIVSCLLCREPACATCYPVMDKGSGWFYACAHCINFTSSLKETPVDMRSKAYKTTSQMPLTLD